MAAPMLTSVLAKFSRLSLSGFHGSRHVHTQMGPLCFKITDHLDAMPMRKKKKVDPAILMQREQKKRKKIERMIKKLERFSRQLKPVDEIVGDPKIKRELDSRRRERVPLSYDESEGRVLLHKAWARYKMSQHIRELTAISNAFESQQRALDELRAESEDLYQMAIQTEDNLLPLELKGPTETPPIKDFEPYDGEYVDKSRKYEK